MTPTDRLFQLLPLVYRERDAVQGYPLRALLRVLEEQWQVVESEIGQLYDNWFIETCQDWVVPYLGDLIDYPLPKIPADRRNRAVRDLTRALTPRREVANTIRYRRRRGALSLLEQLSRDIAGWPARAVEFDRLVSATQSLDYSPEFAPATVDLRRSSALDLLGSPFDPFAHTVDLRRPDSAATRGLYNLQSVAVFVSRLRSYPLTKTLAYRLEEAGDACFSFSPLGNAAPLYRKPESSRPAHAASELDLPGPIRRRAFEERVVENGVKRRHASAAYYGPDKSLSISTTRWNRSHALDPVPRERIVPADLTDWHYRPKPGYIAVDPVLGRLSFAPGDEPEGDVIVSYHYGFAAEIGGGEYPRDLRAPADAAFYAVHSGGREDIHALEAAVHRWHKEQPPDAIIEIADSQVYTVPRFDVELSAGQHLEIRAAQGCRPVIRLVDIRAGRGDPMTVRAHALSRLSLDGLVITGRPLHVSGDLASLTIRHSTFVPGWALNHDCRPRQLNEPSIVFAETGARLIIENSIVGGIQANENERRFEPNLISIADSIVDSASRQGGALGAADAPHAYASLTVRRSTVLGVVAVQQLALGENSIFTAPLRVARRQAGCVRYSYVPLESAAPRQYRCQPATALAGLSKDEAKAAERGLAPIFNSTRYGSPDYCQLAESCPPEIRGGADDESEMGAFHDLYEPQRYENLLSRLRDYVPAGYDVGIIFTTEESR